MLLNFFPSSDSFQILSPLQKISKTSRIYKIQDSKYKALLLTACVCVHDIQFLIDWFFCNMNSYFTLEEKLLTTRNKKPIQSEIDQKQIKAELCLISL